MKNMRIANLRRAVRDNGLAAYYLNSNDYHLSEYVPEYFRTIAYFSGFTGSVSTLIVDPEKAYIFVDGRYHIQAEQECLPNEVEVIKLGTEGALQPEDFLASRYKGKTVGIDGKRTSIDFAKKLLKKGLQLKSIDIYSAFIESRVPLSCDKLRELPLEETGLSRKEKLRRVRYCLGGRTHVIDNLESIAWLLNLRGNDIAYTPVFLSFVVFYRNDVYFFINLERLDEELLERLYDDGVIIRPYASYYDMLGKISRETVILDRFKVNYESYQQLKKHHNTLVHMTSVVEDMKAIKNETEINNTIKAHIYDGVAMVRFLKWIKEADKETLNEYDVAERLNRFRLEYRAFDLSFRPIVAYGANAAMMHYGPTAQKNTQLKNEGILLVDSGGQYNEGTTDITRTFALGPVSDVIRKHFTIVLRSMFELSEVRFMSGMSGKQLDILARKNIWAEGIDYRCGTGHGVGHVLAVHEGPPNIRYMRTANGSEDVALKPGHIVSDEPGIYLEGKYGLRCENMLLVEKDLNNEYGQFLSFRTLTMCPFDRELIDKRYLDEKTLKALNDYHRQVFETLSPYLDEDEKEYLKKACEEI